MPAFTASMNFVVTATLMLKFVTCVRSSLQVMNSMMSGMIDAEDAHVRAAPRAALLHRVGGGIIELHERDRVRSRRRSSSGPSIPSARRRENEKPVPPPL